MKKRSAIAEKYKWDTAHIYATEDDFNNDLQFLRNQIDVLKSYKGKLNNKKDILAYFKLSSKLDLVEEKLGAYVYLNYSENLENQQYVQIMNTLENIGTELSVATSFEESELMANGVDFLNTLLADKDFKVYHLGIIELMRGASHILSDAEEAIISKTSSFLGGFSRVFDNIDALDVKFEDFEVNGKKYKVDNSTIPLLYENKNPEVRENVFKSVHNGYIKLQNTIATNYIEQVKKDTALTRIYKYDNRLQSALFGDNLPKEIYTNLIEQVNNNVNLLHEYLRLRKKALKLDTLKYSDLRIGLADYPKKFDYEKMCETLYEAVKPLGEKYVETVKHAVDNRWIDVFPNEGKDTGAYSLGVYGVHPYILLNTVDNVNSMFTLAHEMGHTMHSYLSDNTQPQELADYPIFLAEIASTTNEVLMLKYLYNKATTKKEKIYLLDMYLLMFRTTLFRQTMFSEFEHFAHVKVENNEPVSKDILREEYARLNKVYHGKAIKHCKEIEYEWLRIPHFYRSYYVYKYSTGIISAISIASRVIQGKDVDKYIEFLSSGGSDYPHNILKKVGVDLTTKEPFEQAFKEMQWALKELKKVLSN